VSLHAGRGRETTGHGHGGFRTCDLSRVKRWTPSLPRREMPANERVARRAFSRMWTFVAVVCALNVRSPWLATTSAQSALGGWHSTPRETLAVDHRPARPQDEGAGCERRAERVANETQDRATHLCEQATAELEQCLAQLLPQNDLDVILARINRACSQDHVRDRSGADPCPEGACNTGCTRDPVGARFERLRASSPWRP